MMVEEERKRGGGDFWRIGGLGDGVTGLGGSMGLRLGVEGIELVGSVWAGKAMVKPTGKIYDG